MTDQRSKYPNKCLEKLSIAEKLPIGSILLGVVFGAVLACLFGSALVRLGQYWIRDANYTHCFAIPLISIWLAWRWLMKHTLPAKGLTLLGSMEIVAGLMLHMVYLLLHWLPIEYFALALVLRGFTLCVGGKEWARGFVFPILFLVFMFPLPYQLSAALGLWLQDLVSSISYIIFSWFTTCYMHGTTLHLVGISTPLQIAEDCSGLRQIEVFLAICALVGHLNRSRLWRRGLLILLSIPVAIAVNVLRVFLIAAGLWLFGNTWVLGWTHHMPALLTIPVGLAVLFLFSRLLESTFVKEVTNDVDSKTSPHLGQQPADDRACRSMVACRST